MTVDRIAIPPARYIGLSTDTKPTIGIKNGSVFLVADTGVEYLYSGTAWVVDFGNSATVEAKPRRAILVGDSITARGNYSTTITALTQTGGVATATSTSHGLYPGSLVFIGNADQEGYNGLKTVIARTSSSEFTFAVDSGTVSPATGTNIFSTSIGRLSDRNWFEMANAQLGHPFAQVINAGGSGQTTTQIAARFDRDVLAYANPGDLIQIQGGINELINSSDIDATVAQTKANFLEMIKKTIAAGCIPLVVTCLPFDSSASGYSTTADGHAVLRLNQYLRELADYTFPRMILFDAWASVVNPTDATGDFISSPTAYSTDFTHPTALACQRMSQDLATVLAEYKYTRTQWVGSVFDSYDNDTSSRQIDPNPLNTGTGGTKSTSGAGSGTNTGNAPDSYTITLTRATTGTAVSSIVSRADGMGSDWQVVFVSQAANDAIDIVQTSQLHARVSAGDILVAECNLVGTSLTNISNVSFAFEWASDGVTYTQPAAIGTAASGQITDDFDWVLRTPPLTVPAAGMTGLKTRLKVTGAGVGGATIKWGRHSIVKLQVTP